MNAYYNEFDPKAAPWLRQLIKNGNITPGEVDERSITEVSADDLMGFDRVHFFAGIGTWDYCLNQAGWGDRQIWTASLPCQPFSAAGKGLGKADERHLLPHFLELVRECRPDRIFGEQVERAIAHGWLDDLQANMEAEGYAVGHCVLGAHSIGAPHIRQRLYWVADSKSERIGRTGRSGDSQAGTLAHSWRPENRESPELVAGSAAIRLADNSGTRYQEQSGISGILRKENGNESRKNSPGSGGMVYADEPGSQPGIEATESSRYGDTVESASSVDGLGNTESIDEQRYREQEAFDESQESFGRPSVSWIFCRDNKFRPIEPSIQPLVDGIAGRMVQGSNSSASINANATQEARAMRLKGYGNAIHAQTAIAFIKAYMSITK